MLLIIGGLPGTGKSTIARLLAARLGAVWLRIDSIEQALIRAETVTRHDIGPAGYLAAYAIAADNLRQGNVVIADSVNPIAITRQAWRAVATENAAPYLEIELTCSDQCSIGIAWKTEWRIFAAIFCRTGKRLSPVSTNPGAPPA